MCNITITTTTTTNDNNININNDTENDLFVSRFPHHHFLSSLTPEFSAHCGGIIKSNNCYLVVGVKRTAGLPRGIQRCFCNGSKKQNFGNNMSVLSAAAEFSRLCSRSPRIPQIVAMTSR